MSTWNRNRWIEDAKERVLRNTGREDAAAREMIFLYDEAANSVEKEINALYARFAKDNRLTDAEAAQLLSGKEYSTWHKSIKEYIEAASDQARGSKALLELNTLAMKSRISQKEQLLANIYRNMIDLAEDTNVKMERLLGDLLQVTYYESCFSIQRGIGMGFNVSKIDSRMIREVLEHPWSEKHFSEAVWGACDHLSALAKREISLGLIQGSSVQKMAKAIDDVMDKGRYNAERLVRTECKYFAGQGELMGYKETGVDEYRFLGGGEGGNCICGELNGKIFKVAEAVAGINYPPIHPNCVCTEVAFFSKSVADYAKNATPLSENIKFQEWKAKYVDNPGKGAKMDLTEDEHQALNAYLSSDSYKLNEKLRRGKKPSKADERFMSALDSALDKMPEKKGMVYRSITTDEIDDIDAFLAGYEVGFPTASPAYTSASVDIYDKDMPIQYVIKSKHGKDISQFNDREQEVLFKRGTYFVPTKIEGTTIYLEEI